MFRRVATNAYTKALEGLDGCLTLEELEQVNSRCRVQDVHLIATRLQDRCSKSAVKSHARMLVEVLDHYSQVMDVLAQAHPEFMCLFWGGLKWLLEVSVADF